MIESYHWRTDAEVIFLSYSGGTQSSSLFWMLREGVIQVDVPVVLVLANPGMEKRSVESYNLRIEKACEANGFEFIRANGRDLYQDLRNRSGRTRIDNPPFWTKTKSGKRGKLAQKCTREYKIRPILRAIRRWLHDNLDAPLPPSNRNLPKVEQWIGFAYEESGRVESFRRSAVPNFCRVRFPLHELNLIWSDVSSWMIENGIPFPDRSLCVGCPFNGLDSLNEMWNQRFENDNWTRCVEVDVSVRCMEDVGVENPVYVSSTLLPLTELADRGFKLDSRRETAEAECNSGICFA